MHGVVVQARDVTGDIRVSVHSDTAASRGGPIVVGRIPQRPTAMLPRAELYGQLAATGTAGSVHVLVGLRGTGKTQLAAAYARACINEKWRVVAWIGAERSDDIVAGLTELANALHLPEHQGVAPSEATAVLASRWLETAEHCLVVFDNAVDPDVLARWLPTSGKPRLVITSTQRSFENLGQLVDVDTFTVAESSTYLRERTKIDDEPRAVEVAEAVGHLPLALAQSAAVISRQHLTYAAFLERLRTTPVESYLARRPGEPYPHGAAQAVLLSIESAEREVPDVGRVLDLLAVHSPSGVDREHVRRLIGMTAASTDHALAALGDASLLSFGIDRSTVLVHRFVQRVVRDRAAHRGSLLATVRDAARSLVELVTEIEMSLVEGRYAYRLAQHADALWAAAESHLPSDGPAELDDVMKLRAWKVTLFLQNGPPAEAIEHGHALVADCERVLGPTHVETWRAHINLAGAYSTSGEHDRACALLDRIRRRHTDTLADTDPMIMTTRYNLAYTHLEAGRGKRAITMLERVLADRARVLGTDHPDTLITRNALGAAYLAVHRCAEAITLLEQVLSDRLRVLGQDHPEIVMTLDLLARAHAHEGHANEVLALREEILGRWRRRMPPGSNDVVIARSRVADACVAAGQFDKALDVLRRNLAEITRQHGSDSPVTQVARRNLAMARASRDQRG